MDCKTSSIKSARAAVTIFEVLISLGVAMLVALALVALTMYFSRSLSMVMNHVEIEAKSRAALDAMSRDLRRATAVTTLATNAITVTVSSNAVTYAFNSGDRTLTRVERNSLGTVLDTRVFLRECTSASFDTYQRNATNAAYNAFPSATTSDAKIVRLRWSLTRTNYSNKLTVGTVSSARVVLRNKGS